MKKNSLFFKVLLIIFFIVSQNKTNGNNLANTSDRTIIIQDKYITVEKIWDAESRTYYFLSRVKHRDENGKLLKIQMEATVVDSGETIPQFVDRLNTPIIAANASTVLSNKPPWPKTSSGILIIDGEVIEDKNTSYFTLGIKANNELIAYPSGTTASQIIKDGALNAVTAFTPIIQDYKPVPHHIISLVKNQLEVHPRQVIAQFDNFNILFLSCGGRGYDGEGMTAFDVIRILQNLDNQVKFAYNLDGGGSTTTVIYGEQITPKIDKSGTINRTRTNCIFINSNED